MSQMQTSSRVRYAHDADQPPPGDAKRETARSLAIKVIGKLQRAGETLETVSGRIDRVVHGDGQAGGPPKPTEPSLFELLEDIDRLAGEVFNEANKVAENIG